LALSVLTFYAGGCASVPRSGPNFIPADSDRVVQVVGIARRSEILGTPTYQLFVDGGITDAQIIDGSEAAGIVYCCGENHSLETALTFYVPPDVTIHQGDVVEIKTGGAPNGSQYGTVNRARVVRETRQKFPNHCHWLPPDENEGTSRELWGRILYCDWMAQEGWTEKNSVTVHTWYKPPTD
jgi:hypothetical protein